MSDRQVVLTPQGLQRIEDELRVLQTVRRQDVAEQIRQAKELGDVSENAEYETAKTEQAFLESRIAELKGILNNCFVIEEEDIRTDVIGIGSVATVKDLDYDEEWSFMMVGSFEANPEEDRISNESPIGDALFGKQVGDEVSAKIPAGNVRLKVLAINKPKA
ncbi:MAG: transcription elongation factor GreA [Actinomycetota bacterium]